MNRLSHFQEKVIKCVFECIVVIGCLVISNFTHSKLLEVVDIVLLVFLCVTLTVNIINVIRHKVHYDKETTRKERTAAEIAIIGLIMLMMSFSLANAFFSFHIQVTPKLTDIILYSVLALRDGVYIYLTLREKNKLHKQKIKDGGCSDTHLFGA